MLSIRIWLLLLVGVVVFLNNGLLVNPKKCQAIIIFKNNLQTPSTPPVIINDALIPYCKSVRSLGVMLNTTLS